MKPFQPLAMRKLIQRCTTTRKIYEQEEAKIRKELTPFTKQTKNGSKKVEVRFQKKSITGSNRTLAAFRQKKSLLATYELAKNNPAIAATYDTLV